MMGSQVEPLEMFSRFMKNLLSGFMDGQGRHYTVPP